MMYASWAWFLWFGLIFLLFSSVGNWGYTYRAHRRHDQFAKRDALDLLDERYARGGLGRDEYLEIKKDILSNDRITPLKKSA